MASNVLLNPVFTGEGRVFINPAGFGGGTKFQYHNNMKIDGIDRSLGDIEPVYVPNPYKYDDFIEVAGIKGADSRLTSTLSGKLPINTYSPLEILADRRCAFNLQVHYGRCTKPDDFVNFDSAIILKDVLLTSYNLSTLVAVVPGERALIDESAAITAKKMYRVFNQDFLVLSPNTDGRVLRITHGDLQGCSELCSAYSDGNLVWIALVDGVSANSFAVTRDGGLTWTQFASGATAHTLTAMEAVLAVAGNYVIWSVTDNSSATKIYAADLITVVSGITPTAIELDLFSDFIPRDITVTDDYVYIVGTDADGAFDGKLIKIDKDTLEISVLFESGDGITSIHALTNDKIMIGLSSGEVYVSEVAGFFNLINSFGSSGIPHVHMHDDTHYVVTTPTSVHVTSDGGQNWTRTYTLNFANNDSTRPIIAWYDNIVGYLQFGGSVYRTIDSGTTWKRVYLGGTSDESLSVAVSPYNPNLIMGAYNVDSNSSASFKGFV